MKLSKNRQKVLKISLNSKISHQPEAVLTFFKKVQFTKFDSTIDAVFNLNVNPKRVEHNLKGTYQLVHPFEQKIKIAIFTTIATAQAEQLKVAVVGGIELIKTIAKTKQIPFDVAVATPEIMPELAKIGKILGPRKLMPNLKIGTVTNQLGPIVQKLRAGLFKYQVDAGGNICFKIGKLSQSVDHLVTNFNAIFKLVKTIKPQFVKKQYLQQISVSSTMSPSFKINF